MVAAIQPFRLPKKLPPMLTRVQRAWKDLVRSENEMPFSDDIDPTAFSKVSAHLVMIDVFDGPQRFRFNRIGEKIMRKLGANIDGKFVDEVEIQSPFDYLVAQASATVEGRVPTFYTSSSSRQNRAGGYKRILLPAWGNGRIELLLGAIV